MLSEIFIASITLARDEVLLVLVAVTARDVTRLGAGGAEPPSTALGARQWFCSYFTQPGAAAASLLHPPAPWFPVQPLGTAPCLADPLLFTRGGMGQNEVNWTRRVCGPLSPLSIEGSSLPGAEGLKT